MSIVKLKYVSTVTSCALNTMVTKVLLKKAELKHISYKFWPQSTAGNPPPNQQTKSEIEKTYMGSYL